MTKRTAFTDPAHRPRSTTQKEIAADRRPPPPRRIVPSTGGSQVTPRRSRPVRRDEVVRGKKAAPTPSHRTPAVEVVFAVSGEGALEIRWPGGRKIRLGRPETIRLELPEAVRRDLLETIRGELLDVRARLLEAVLAQLREAVPSAPSAPPPRPEPAPDPRLRDEQRRERLIETLTQTYGNVAHTARTMGTWPEQIRRWCRRFGVSPARFRPSRLPPYLRTTPSAPTLRSTPARQPAGLRRSRRVPPSTSTR